jgi:hypothetical protein
MPILPTQKTPPRKRLQDYPILLYGRPGIGKTTFASKAPDAVFLATEPGLKALDAYEAPIRSWEDAEQAFIELESGNHQFRTVIVDTIDLLYKFCAEYTCKELQVVHEADAGYGKGRGLINRTFHNYLSRLCNLPYGVILIGHAKWKKRREGEVEESYIGLSLPDEPTQLVNSMVSVIIYADIVQVKTSEGTKDHRVIKCTPTTDFEAKDHTGKLPPQIPFDYEAMEDAFKSGGIREAAPNAEEYAGQIIEMIDQMYEQGGVDAVDHFARANWPEWKNPWPSGCGGLAESKIAPYIIQIKETANNGDSDTQPDPEAKQEETAKEEPQALTADQKRQRVQEIKDELFKAEGEKKLDAVFAENQIEWFIL